MPDYLSAELTATCAVLGYYDGTNYHLDKNCLGKIVYFTLYISFINFFKNIYMFRLIIF